jgi:hypothetical protein
LLRREPVLNTIALGLLKEAAEPAQRSNWLFATVEREGRIVAAAFRSDLPRMGLAAQVHELREVRPQNAVEGRRRMLGADDLELATGWMTAFFAESGPGNGVSTRPGSGRSDAAHLDKTGGGGTRTSVWYNQW